MVASPRAFKGRFFTVAISLIIIAILITILVDRIGQEIDKLELSGFELRVSEIRSLLLLKQLEILAQGDRGQAKSLDGMNPIEWIEGWPKRKPSYYMGEIRLEKAVEAEGYWAYDPVQKVIAYLPKSTIWLADSEEWRHLAKRQFINQDAEVEGVKRWLKYRVKAVYSGNEFQSLKLQPVD